MEVFVPTQLYWTWAECAVYNSPKISSLNRLGALRKLRNERKMYQKKHDCVTASVHTMLLLSYSFYPPLYRTASINAQCWSMPIKKLGIDPKYRSMPTIADWSMLDQGIRKTLVKLSISADPVLIGIDRYWLALGSMLQFWSVLISIGQWSRESWL